MSSLQAAEFAGPLQGLEILLLACEKGLQLCGSRLPALQRRKAPAGCGSAPCSRRAGTARLTPRSEERALERGRSRGCVQRGITKPPRCTQRHGRIPSGSRTPSRAQALCTGTASLLVAPVYSYTCTEQNLCCTAAEIYLEPVKGKNQPTDQFIKTLIEPHPG